MSKEAAKDPAARKPKALYSVASYKVDDSIGYLLKVVRTSLTCEVDRRMADHEISHDQWGVLIVMAKGQGATAAELARLLEQDTGSMTRMIDRLEAKGFLARRRSEEDRRVVWLELTTAGRKLAETLTSVVVDVLNQHLKGFSVDELDTLKSFLRRMLANRS
jgi:DNA-binding MarR family transcriptional regulator